MAATWDSDSCDPGTLREDPKCLKDSDDNQNLHAEVGSLTGASVQADPELVTDGTRSLLARPSTQYGKERTLQKRVQK